jgi:UDP-N-acetylglucosamine 1-carboxyvinyltransferase
MRRRGAEISVDGAQATVTGVRKLHGAHLRGCELRGTAALVVAALAAEGESVVTGLEYLDRGYEDIKNLLFGLGAAIKRVEIS